MAKTKKVAPAKKEETFTEKIGHAIGSVTGAIVEKYNELVHPDDKKPAKKKTPAKKVVPVNKAVTKKKAAPTKKPVQSKAPAKKAAPKKTVKKVARKK